MNIIPIIFDVGTGTSCGQADKHRLTTKTPRATPSRGHIIYTADPSRCQPHIYGKDCFYFLIYPQRVARVSYKSVRLRRGVHGDVGVETTTKCRCSISPCDYILRAFGCSPWRNSCPMLQTRSQPAYDTITVFLCISSRCAYSHASPLDPYPVAAIDDGLTCSSHLKTSTP